MKKFFVILCVLFLFGCSKNKLTDEEINLKYNEMENQLIKYGELVYVNEQWINEDAEPTTSFMTLKEMSEINKYDISMFVNPVTNKKCDLDKTKIIFTIKDVSDLNNIIYEFEPVLVCGD